jgi:WD40 repeat protein
MLYRRYILLLVAFMLISTMGVTIPPIGVFAYPTYSPNGEYIAVANYMKIRIYNNDFSQLLNEFVAWPEFHSGIGIWQLVWSPDGTMLAAGLNGFKLQIWEVENGRQITEINDVMTEYPVFWDNNSTSVVVAHGQASIRRYEIPSGRLLDEIMPDPPARIEGFAWNPQQAQGLVYLDGESSGLYALDTTTKEFEYLNPSSNGAYSAYSYNPSGTLIARTDGLVDILDSETHTLVSRLDMTPQRILSVTWINDYELTTTTEEDDLLITSRWDVETGDRLGSYLLDEGMQVNHTGFSPDGNFFAVTSLREGETYLYHAETGEIVAILGGDLYAPSVSLSQVSPQSESSASETVVFSVEFSKSVSGFDNRDIHLSGTAGATQAVVTGSGSVYRVTVSGMTQPGTVIVSIPANAAQDAAGNGILAVNSIPTPQASDDDILDQTACLFPCWHGLMPGITTDVEIQNFLDTDAFVAQAASDFSQTVGDELEYIWVYEHGESILDSKLVVKNGILHSIYIDPAIDFTLEQIINIYGEPAGFTYYYDLERNKAIFIITVYYPTNGLIINFTLYDGPPQINYFLNGSAEGLDFVVLPAQNSFADLYGYYHDFDTATAANQVDAFYSWGWPGLNSRIAEPVAAQLGEPALIPVIVSPTPVP